MKCIKCGEEFEPVVTDEDSICGTCLVLDGDDIVTDLPSIVRAIGRLNSIQARKGINEMIGKIILLEKYKFVPKELVAEIIRDVFKEMKENNNAK